MMQVLVLIWLSTLVKASAEKVFQHHIIYITMQYLGVHDCLHLILQNKTFYTTYRPVMIDVIFQRHHKQLKNPDAMDYNAAYSNLAFIQEVTQLDPMIREILINNAILVLFNGANPPLEILCSDVTGREQLFNRFRENKGLCNYKMEVGFIWNGRSIRLAFDPLARQNELRLPLVYDPCFATVVCYHKSLNDPTNVILTMKRHIPAILFVNNGENTYVEEIATCKCLKVYLVDERKSEGYMLFKSTTYEIEYLMFFNNKGFLDKIKIFSRGVFLNQISNDFMFAEKNKYIIVSTNNLNIESIYTSYFPVGLEELHPCFNEMSFPKKTNSFCNIV